MLIALIVLGPKRLPDAARQIGKTMGDLRRLSTGFQNEVRTRPRHAPTTRTGWPPGATSSPRTSRPATAGAPAASGAHRAARRRPRSRAARTTPADRRRPRRPRRHGRRQDRPRPRPTSGAEEGARQERHAGQEGRPGARSRAAPHQDLMSTSAVPDGARRRSHVAHGAPHGAPRPDHQDRHRARGRDGRRVRRSTTRSSTSCIQPYEDIASTHDNVLGEGQLLQIDPLEGFGVRMKLALYAGIAIAMPVILWQIWRFVTPASTRTRSATRSRSS